MRQLSGHDASFVYLETPKAHMAGGSLQIYDQSTAPGGRVTFTGILEDLEGRLHLASIFRQRLLRVPMDLDHPYWVDDSQFDLEYHVRHIALPQPGDWRQLCILCARLLARPLDMSKPLWEMYVIEGLDNIGGVPAGSYATLIKTHHAAMDGTSGMQMLSALHDQEPDPEPPGPAAEWRPEREPTPMELMARASVNNMMRPTRLAATMSRVYGGSRALTRQALAGEVQLPPPLPVPSTIFNANVSAHRVVEGRRFPLSETKRIRTTVAGATVNDVVLTVVGGALRRYLDAHSALPPDSLVVMCPISLRAKGDVSTEGNQVGAMTVPLGTHIANPLRRLDTVHRATAQSKLIQEAVDARQMTEIAQHLPGALLGAGARLSSDVGLATPPASPPPYNTVVTNIPGPQEPLYSGGARLVAMYGLGMVHDGMGLMHVVSSYCGDLTISFTGDREMMPDPGFYAACLEASSEELATAAT
jgi:diacylglycerol O-acyltransferase / wax synthase